MFGIFEKRSAFCKKMMPDTRDLSKFLHPNVKRKIRNFNLDNKMLPRRIETFAWGLPPLELHEKFMFSPSVNSKNLLLASSRTWDGGQMTSICSSEVCFPAEQVARPACRLRAAPSRTPHSPLDRSPSGVHECPAATVPPSPDTAMVELKPGSRSSQEATAPVQAATGHFTSRGSPSTTTRISSAKPARILGGKIKIANFLLWILPREFCARNKQEARSARK